MFARSSVGRENLFSREISLNEVAATHYCCWGEERETTRGRGMIREGGGAEGLALSDRSGEREVRYAVRGSIEIGCGSAMGLLVEKSTKAKKKKIILCLTAAT